MTEKFKEDRIWARHRVIHIKAGLPTAGISGKEMEKFNEIRKILDEVLEDWIEQTIILEVKDE